MKTSSYGKYIHSQIRKEVKAEMKAEVKAKMEAKMAESFTKRFSDTSYAFLDNVVLPKTNND